MSGVVLTDRRIGTHTEGMACTEGWCSSGHGTPVPYVHDCAEGAVVHGDLLDQPNEDSWSLIAGCDSCDYRAELTHTPDQSFPLETRETPQTSPDVVVVPIVAAAPKPKAPAKRARKAQ